jgi:hypothetical protein
MSNESKELKMDEQNQDKPQSGKGRQTTYDPKYCEAIVQVARKGGDDAAMVIACGLKSRKSMWRWRQKYPEFQEAYNYAKLIQLERDEAIMDAYILGKIPKGQFRALEMRLKAANPEKYGAPNLPSIQNATQINIQGDLKAIEGMDMSELDKKINETMKRLGVMSIEEEDGGIRTVDAEDL